MMEHELLKDSSYKKDRIGSALQGENPTLVTRLKTGFVFLMDYQFLPGWCVLVAYPEVKDLNALKISDRTEFLKEMSILGEAIEKVVNPIRMNYSILGNTDNYLHAHVYPRYHWEAPEKLKKPAWNYFNDPQWISEKWHVNTSHAELANSIKEAINLII